ncbi:MAG TPA: HepT-like ribonuclease domain-containing protein [Thermoanaerobaculia bacterium]|nr:HepT-like ribonuclease domain-containing protein [Thermoanaerobaculia bacterium]
MQDGVMRNLQIIGEAARKVSDESRATHSGIPWTEIIGMRNRLVHEYFRIDVEKIWETARDDIPALVRLIEPLVPPEDPS